MQIGSIIGIFTAIIGVAFLATALSHSSTATIIKNIFDGFAGSLRAAMGH
ncbi:MAG TPA: hypothetical protein VF916_11445 [Ktedonobacterales bacterium]